MTSRRGCVLAWRRRHQDGRAARRAAPAAASAGREAAPAAARGVQRGTRQPPPPQPALASQGQAAPPAAPPAGAALAVPGEPASSSSCSSGSLSGSASEPASACSAAWPLSGSPSSLLPPCRAAGPCLSGRGGRRAQRTGLGRGAAHHGAGGAIGRHEVRLGDVKEAAAVLGRRARLARLGARPWRAPAHTQRRRWRKDPVHGFSPCARGGPTACRPLPESAVEPNPRASPPRRPHGRGRAPGGAGGRRVPSGDAVDVEGRSESERRPPAASLRRMASSAALLDQVAAVAAAYSDATAAAVLLPASSSASPCRGAPRGRPPWG